MARVYPVVSISSSDSFQPLLLTRFLFLKEVSFISVSFWISIPPNFSLKLTDWYLRKKAQRIFSECVWLKNCFLKIFKLLLNLRIIMIEQNYTSNYWYEVLETLLSLSIWNIFAFKFIITLSMLCFYILTFFREAREIKNCF